MNKPFVCPKCEGAKKIEGKKCSVCEGQGVIWKSSDSLKKAGDSFTKEVA